MNNDKSKGGRGAEFAPEFSTNRINLNDNILSIENR